jgi:adenylate cyclase
MAPRSSRLLSLRISLLVALPVVVALTGVAIALPFYVTTREGVRALATTLFRQVGEQTSQAAISQLRQASPIADLVADDFSDEDPLPSSDDIALRLLPFLRSNPTFSWVCLGEESGRFTGIERQAEGRIVINQSYILENGATHVEEREVQADGSWKLISKRDDGKYDPRKRPFYIHTAAAKKRTWTGPYLFFKEGVPGITTASPILAKDGKLRGVVSVDFDLNSLSGFVAGMHPSQHATVFVYTDTKVLLAHPTVRVARGTTEAGPEGHLLTVEDVPDDAFKAYFSSGAAERPERGFSHKGETYLAVTHEFQPDEGLAWRVGAFAPESDFMGGLDRAWRFSIAISGGAVLLSVIMAVVFARSLARPLAALSAEMDSVGRFEVEEREMPSSLYREIEMMTHALSSMKKGLRSFASYVPRALVREVLASGQEAVLGGTTKQATIFFSDLAGFTTLAESMEPAALVELLGGYFDQMTKVIAENRGTVDKFIGDAIMAFWNAPHDDAQHARMACLAALGCQRRLENMKALDSKLAGLSARVGLATGEVLVGNIGAPDRMNYTVMGDTVNLASRLEGLGKKYGTGILVNHATYEAAKDAVVMRQIDLVAVKGKKRGVAVYEPLAIRGLNEEDTAGAERVAALAAEAFAAYLAMRFTEAARLFDALIQERGGKDVAAELLRDRCRELGTTPPAEPWNGVAVMHEK